jgi:hypothetical protein
LPEYPHTAAFGVTRAVPVNTQMIAFENGYARPRQYRAVPPGAGAHSPRAHPHKLPRLHAACRAVPSARLEHSSGTVTYRATRSGDAEGPAHGPVAVGARRWVGRWESSLSQVERGKTGVGSYSVLTWMGTVLQVEVEELTDAEGVTARRDNACTSRRRRSSGL